MDPDCLIAFAEARQTLTVRVIDSGRTADGAALVDETLAGYRDYVAIPGSDHARVIADLIQFEPELLGVELTDALAAVRALEAEVGSE